MAGEHGVRQFLDLGSGLPTQGTTHEAVRQLAPDARLVYVDNDPMVLDYARKTLNGTARTAVIAGDMREPEQLFTEPAFTELIDLTQPLGLLLTGVLQFVDDETDPWQLMARYRAAMVPGSYVAISHCTADRAAARGGSGYSRRLRPHPLPHAPAQPGRGRAALRGLRAGGPVRRRRARPDLRRQLGRRGRARR